MFVYISASYRYIFSSFTFSQKKCISDYTCIHLQNNIGFQEISTISTKIQPHQSQKLQDRTEYRTQKHVVCGLGVHVSTVENGFLLFCRSCNLWIVYRMHSRQFVLCKLHIFPKHSWYAFASKVLP